MDGGTCREGLSSGLLGISCATSSCSLFTWGSWIWCLSQAAKKPPGKKCFLLQDEEGWLWGEGRAGALACRWDLGILSDGTGKGVLYGQTLPPVSELQEYNLT